MKRLLLDPQALILQSTTGCGFETALHPIIFSILFLQARQVREGDFVLGRDPYQDQELATEQHKGEPIEKLCCSKSMTLYLRVPVFDFPVAIKAAERTPVQSPFPVEAIPTGYE